jgi:catechol 2,3-dioxygenase-like lactoylglutathione lyase family enzyme
MSGFDHLGFSAGNYPRSRAFYVAALAPLGIRETVVYDNERGKISGFGNGEAFFWVGDGEPSGGQIHVAFRAASRAEVDAFYAAAMAAGGTDNGAPGLRPHYHANYYGAFVLDPDGHNIEAVYHGPA